MALTTHPQLAPRLKKSRITLLLLLFALMAGYRVKFKVLSFVYTKGFCGLVDEILNIICYEMNRT
jgi:hypothetical protein